MVFLKKFIFYSIIFSTFLNFFFLVLNKDKTFLNEDTPIFMNQIKNSDLLTLLFSNKKFLDISNYLNSKFESKIHLRFYQAFIPKNKKRIKKKKRKKIVLYSVDLFSLKFHKYWLKNLLKDRFIIKFDNNKPDYLLYNVFGSEHLNPKYNNSIKIAIFTENIIPDFIEVDYAIGHYHINYLDRYFKYNIFFWRDINNFYMSRNKALNSPKRLKFCAALISNNISTDEFRLEFINELSKYKKVDMGGAVGNNIRESIKDKIKFFSSYKFSIAMENSNGDGYISEKIVDSFLAGTIPIYYGDYMVDEYINPKTYILIKGKKDINKKIEYIKEIDNNDELYKKLLKENVLLDKNIVIDTKKELKEFLYNIFEQDKSKAYRKQF